MRPVRLLVAYAILPAATSSSRFRIEIFNEGGEELSLYWTPPRNQGQPELKEVIPADQLKDQWTERGHEFLVSAGKLEQKLSRPARIRPTGEGKVSCRSAGKKVHCKEEYSASPRGNKRETAARYTGERWDKLVDGVKANCSSLLEHDEADQEHFCNPNFKEWFWTQCHFDMTDDEMEGRFKKIVQDKSKQIAAQVQMFKNFTDVGFEVRKMPQDLLEELQAFWRESRLARSRPENHPKLDPVNPGCLSDTWMLDLPPHQRERVANKLRPVVAAWSGFAPEDLEWTSFYGVRLYRKGAILEWHADRQDTHVLSVIMQLGVLGFGEEPAPPWPLEIISHDGVKHTVPQVPGEFVLYESATCPHARPGRFQGRETANVFVHFAPKGWPDKFLAARASEL